MATKAPKAPTVKKSAAKAKPAPAVKGDKFIHALLDGKAERPPGTNLNDFALAALRQMDKDGNYAPDALFTSIMASGKEDAGQVRHAVDLAIVQVRKDHGLQ